MKTAHTQAQRDAALELYKQHGPAETARRTGIASGTIRMWAVRAGVTAQRGVTAKANVQAARLTWQQRKAELTVESGQLAAELLARMREAKARDTRDLAVAYGVLIDRAQLLSGDATQRIDTSDQFGREVGRLLGEFDRRDSTQPPA